MAKAKEVEEIRPIVIEDNDNGKKYTLEFNRATVCMAERNGFNLENIGNGEYLSGITDLFKYSFKMHHPQLSDDKIMKLFDGMGGFPDGMIERLTELYMKPYTALVQTEESAKNASVVVTL